MTQKIWLSAIGLSLVWCAYVVWPREPVNYQKISVPIYEPTVQNLAEPVMPQPIAEAEESKWETVIKRKMGKISDMDIVDVSFIKKTGPTSGVFSLKKVRKRTHTKETIIVYTTEVISIEEWYYDKYLGWKQSKVIKETVQRHVKQYPLVRGV